MIESLSIIVEASSTVIELFSTAIEESSTGAESPFITIPKAGIQLIAGKIAIDVKREAA